MYKEKIRNVIDNFGIEENYITKKVLSVQLRSAMKKIKANARRRANSASESDRWLVENLPFLESVYSTINLKRCRIRQETLQFLDFLETDLSFDWSKDELKNVIEEISDVLHLKESELESLRSAF